MKTIFYHNNYGDAVIYSSWMLLYVTISKPDDWWKLVVYFWLNFFYIDFLVLLIWLNLEMKIFAINDHTIEYICLKVRVVFL